MGLSAKIDRARDIVARSGLLARKACVQRLASIARPAQRAHCLLVAGVQRSGTNMVMDVLERSFDTVVYHERDPRAFEKFQLREDHVVQSLIDDARSRIIVVKCLMESQKLQELMQTFAPASALWVFRDYRDVVNSMLRSFSNQANQVRRVAADRNSDGWLGDRMTDATHALISRFADSNLDDATAAAIQWYFRNIRFYEQQLAARDDVLLVEYDKLVTDPAEEFRRIYAFAGIAFSPAVLRGVNADSISRRPAPPINPAVAEICEDLLERLKATAAGGQG